MDELLKNHLFAAHAIAAVGSVTLRTAVTHPLDTLKTLIWVPASLWSQIKFLAEFDQ